MSGGRSPATTLPLVASGLAVLALLAGPVRSQDEEPFSGRPEITIALEPAKVGVGEVARLTISLGGEGFTGGALTEPTFSLENLDVAGGPSRRESLSVVNGRASRTYELLWYLKPREPGPAGVHSARVSVDGREISLPDRSIEVTAEPQRPHRPRRDRRASSFENLVEQFLQGRDRPGAPPARDVSGPPQVHLQASVSRDRPWTGQQVTYRLDLLVERRRPGEGRVRVDSIFPRELPEFEGFWSQEIPLPDQVRPEVVQMDGRTFWRQPVVKRALFPLREGEQRIEAAVLDLRAVHYRSTIFGEEPGQPETIEVRSEPVEIVVRPLPAGPADFSGAIGTGFRLTTSIEPAVLEPDEAATLTATLEGRGHLGGIRDLALPDLDGLRPQTPEESSSRELAGDQIVERRVWSWTLVPAREGRWTIPALTWTYFDPSAGEYRDLRTEPVRLAAAGPTPGPEPTLAGAAESRPTEETPPTDTSSETSGSWFSDRPILLATLGCVLGAALLAVGIRRRGRRADRELLSRLGVLPSESPRRTASAAEEAWREYLETKWALPKGIPCREWPDHLRREGADPDTARELVRLMDDLHYLRYAPQLASSEALGAELRPRSKRILRRL